jgi:hypothetical protein
MELEEEAQAFVEVACGDDDDVSCGGGGEAMCLTEGRRAPA